MELKPRPIGFNAMDHLNQMQAMFDQLFTAGRHGPDLSGQKSPEKSVKESVRKSVDISLGRINLELITQSGRKKS